MPKTLLPVALIALALLVAACGDDDEETTASAPTTTAETAADGSEEGAGGGGGDAAGGDGEGGSKPGIEVTTADSQFGEALFDGDRRAIYYFDKETTATSECYGECAAAWPPVLTEGDPVAGGGAGPKLLGTTERDDGTTQVTYDGRPLYYYVDDPPGEILCHNVDEFGGLWLAVQPSGEAFG